MSNHSTGPPKGYVKQVVDNLLHAATVCVVAPVIVIVLLKAVALTQSIENTVYKTSFHPSPQKEVKALVIHRDRKTGYRIGL